MAAKSTRRMRKGEDTSTDWTDKKKDEDEDKDAKKSDVVDTAGKDDEDKDEESEVKKADEDEDEELMDDEDMTGEFRVRVLADGSIRLVMDDEDEDEEDDEDEDDLEDEQADKSTNPAGRQRVTAASLEKAIAALKTYTDVSDVSERRKALLRQAQSKKGLSKSQARELFVNLGATSTKKSLAERVAASFEQEGALAKSVSDAADSQDVADYLEGISESMGKSLALLSGEVEASSTRQHGANLLLCKAVARIGAAVKAVAERVDAIGQAPSRAPKSMTAQPVQPVQKSFAGAAPSTAITREEAADLLTRMNKATLGTSRVGMTKSNKNIVTAIDVLMTSGAIDPELLQEVQQFKATGRLAD